VIRVAILTISDGAAAGTRRDTSGAAASDWVEGCGWTLAECRVVPDEASQISGELTRWADGGDVDLVLTVGGTGFGPRDVTPEATSAVVQRPAPGISESLRASGLETTPRAMLSRGVAGIRGRTLIVNLPGSEKAVREALPVLQSVVPHAVDLLRGRTEHP
jgi:molybdenum cofactor synthesis domain-containing protein